MFLPEQTPGPSSSSSSHSSSSSSSSRTVPYSPPLASPTPPPGYLVRPVLVDDQQQTAEFLDHSYYDMGNTDPYLAIQDLNPDDPLARRLRAHGKKRKRDNESLFTRAGCQDISNSELSCQPYAGQRIIQNEWFQFQWSSYNPLFNQVDDVSIWLFNGDSGDQVGHWVQDKYQGSIQIQANDSFWGAAGPTIRSGHNQSFPFYFVILPITATVHNGETSEPTFTGIQTALPNSVLAAYATSAASALSTQSVASVASVASVQSTSLVVASALSYSLSSVSSASVWSTATHGTPSGKTQGNSTGNGFPNWAIALIVILAFLLLLAALLGAYLVMGKIRRQRSRKAAMDDEDQRRSVGSASPMIGARGEPTSPTSVGHGGTTATADEKMGLLGAGPLGASLGAGAAAAATGRHHEPAGRGSSSIRGGHVPGAPPSFAGHTDGASMMSSSDTTTTPGMLSGADAMIVADAFRQAMRNPDLSGRPVEEDESPPEENEKTLMNEELKREGRDIRTVPSARDVRVQAATAGGTGQGRVSPKGLGSGAGR